MNSIKKIKEGLKNLSKYEVILFGSWARNKVTIRSDIDIAVISKIKNKEKNMDLWYKLLGSIPFGYDLKIFELLPLPIQMEIINNYVVVFGNHLEISEYFYHFRKIWYDVEKRYEENQFVNLREKRKALQRAKSLIQNLV